MQKEVSDSVTMCSLDLAWQSALRQRLRRRWSRFFRAKTWESTSVPHPDIRWTSECTYMTRYWGDLSSDNTLLPGFPTSDKIRFRFRFRIRIIALHGCSHTETSGFEGKGVTVSARENLFSTSVPLMSPSSVLLQTQLAKISLAHDIKPDPRNEGTLKK